MAAMRYAIGLTRSEDKETTVLATSIREAVREAWLHYPGWEVQYVEGEEVVGRCEACGDPVLEDEDYSVPDEMVCICESCRKGMSDDD